MFKLNVFQWVSVCPLPLVFSLGISQKSVAPSSLPPPPILHVFAHTDMIPLNLLQAEQSQLAQPLCICWVFQSLHHLCALLWDSLQYTQFLSQPILQLMWFNIFQLTKSNTNKQMTCQRNKVTGTCKLTNLVALNLVQDLHCFLQCQYLLNYYDCRGCKHNRVEHFR